MTPAFFGQDGRSLATRVALLTAQARSNSAGPTTLVRLSHESGPSPFGTLEPRPAMRVVERTVSRSELSVTCDALLTQELLDGRSIVLDLPGDALKEPGLANRPDVVRVVPVGPCAIDILFAGPHREIDQNAGSSGRSSVRLLSCGLATGVPGDDGRRLGNAGRAPDRVGGAWLQTGIPHLPACVWDAIVRGEPAAGVLALGHAILREIGGDTTIAPPPGGPEILAARLWGLAMDIQAYEDGHMPDPADLARAPLLKDWSYILRPSAALTGRFSGHPYIHDGARSVTSEVFHTDGRTFARTLSRLYRLGPPAGTELH